MLKQITLALAGNPNAGKTTIFNALTGARQHVGNWPGVTVEKKEGTLKLEEHEIHVVDLPGTYSLTAMSMEELVARNFILRGGADVVVDVVDASNLERNLYLATQLMEMGVKIVMALNMIDVARGRKISIDVLKLSQLLGVPIVATNGKKEMGMKELLDAAISLAEDPERGPATRTVGYGAEVEEEIAKIEEKLAGRPAVSSFFSTRWLAVKMLENDPEIMRRLSRIPELGPVIDQVRVSREHLENIFGDPPEIVLADARYGFVSGAVRQAVTEGAVDRIHLSETIDKVLTNRLLGPVVLVLVLYLVYLFTFRGSEPLVEYSEKFFSWLGETTASIIPAGTLQSLVVSGIIDGVGGVLGFVPLIAFMFFAIAILEDTGYMARIAFMLDRVLRGFGLHGASMLALMVAGGIAGGCAVPGIMATRTMREPKERLATILVTPLMNCGAKLPVYALLIGAFFPGNKPGMMMLLTLISWVMVLTAGRVIRSTVLAGPSAPFVLELPPYRLPTLKGLSIHTWERTWMYIRKAGTVILAISVLLWAVMTFPALPRDQAERFDRQVGELEASFLAEPAVKGTFKSVKDLEEFEKYRRRRSAGNAEAPARVRPAFAALARAISKSAEKGARPPASDLSRLYERFVVRKTELLTEKRIAALKNTIGGRIGTAMEYVTSPLNFDWRTNIALIGGFAAKEVVIATLGTAYSLGEVDPGETGSLQDKLKREPRWNPLTAFTLIMFVMLYAPCFVTLVVMRKETGGLRWPLFAMVYTTTLAYCTALVVHTVGTFLGLGV
jgi:ferrous iron transport protein B